MKPRPPLCLPFVAALLLLPAVVSAEPPALPTDEQVRELLRQRIDVEKRGVGIVVGLVDAQGTRVVSYGRTAKAGGGSEVNGRTMFEIGSVTKVFTSLLLAVAVEKGEVKLDDPVGAFLPPEAHVPTRNGRQITLLDLATHRSGLPQQLKIGKPKNPEDPYADYTPEQVYAYLSGYSLTREIGAEYEYANLGVALLGNALARRAGKPYEQLVTEQILGPFGMKSSAITLSEDERARLALPYGEDLLPAHNWNLGFFAPAGGIRSDVEDMLVFVSAQIGLVPTPLGPAMRTTQQVRNRTSDPQTDIGLNWHINHRYDTPIIWHNGGTGGYRTWVGFDPAGRRGVVVLSNTAIGVDDIGLHLLDSRFPLTPPPKTFTAVPIKPEVADQYAGRYQLAPEFVLTFSREGSRYFIVAADQPKDEVFPDSETDFFSRSFDGQITFVKDAQGRWGSLVLHQGGIPDQTAKRLP